MATLRDIKKRITSVSNTQQITKAMQLVSASKLKRAQEEAEAIVPYANKIAELFSRLTESIDTTDSPLLQNREGEKTLYIVVSSDRGLCGPFNSNLLRHCFQKFTELRNGGHELGLITVGKKSDDFFKKRGFKSLKSYRDVFQRLKINTAIEVVLEAKSWFLSREYDRVVIIYNHFKSVVTQEITEEQILPIKRKDIRQEKETKPSTHIEYEFLPDPQTILETLLPKYLDMSVWKALLDSNAAEQGARMAAMDTATENAKEVIKNLTIYYNRARQAKITQEIAEIVGGAAAL